MEDGDNTLIDNLKDATFLQKQYAVFAASKLTLYKGKREAAQHGESPEFKAYLDELMANNDNIVNNFRFFHFVQELALIDFVAWNNQNILEIVQNLVGQKQNQT